MQPIHGLGGRRHPGRDRAGDRLARKEGRVKRLAGGSPRRFARWLVVRSDQPLLRHTRKLVLTSEDGQATYSRAVGFVVIGLMVGLFFGLVEQWTKSAWLLMKAGPLTGKQFII